MKFIHIADLHLDTPLVSLKNNRELIKQRRTEHRQVFKDVVKLARDAKAQILFISGDLFEQKFIEKNTIEFIINTLQLIPDTKVFITPGNHDPYIKNSPYRTYKWPDNVTIFDSKIQKVSLEYIDVYGFGFEDYEMNSNELAEFKVDNEKKVNVLITHGNIGSKSKYNDLNLKDLAKFDYVALGHIHLKKLDNNIVYPGALVSCGFDECGEHGLVMGNLEKDNITYEFKNMEYTHFDTREIDISNVHVPNDVLDLLDLKDDIYKIYLKGARNVDVKDICDLIKAFSKNVCEIKDETHLPYNLEEIAKSKTLKGIFVKKMLEELKNSPNDKEEIMKAIEITFASL